MIPPDAWTPCPEPACPVGMLGPGWLEHHDDGTHSWTPWTPDEPAHHHYRLIAALALVAAVAVWLIAGGTK
jgi:hypothetical protein